MKRVLSARQLARTKLVSALFLFVITVTYSVT